MRLDHLLSGEEVGVGLLSGCRGASAADRADEPEGHTEYGREGRCTGRYKRAGRARGDAGALPRVRRACTSGQARKDSGGDAFMGHTRTHPEHEG